MKKLYVNIEEIKIKGRVDQLSDMVRTMDRALQNIANNTDTLTNHLARYSVTNKGTQYEKVVNTALKLRDEMFKASVELNDMQKQVVAYQNKVCRYEGRSQSAPPPNKYSVNRRQISVDTSVIQFNRQDMINVAAALKNYSELVYAQIKNINRKKIDIASIWQDRQYKDFENFIQEITNKVIEALKIFDNYIPVLEERIKELE